MRRIAPLRLPVVLHQLVGVETRSNVTCLRPAANLDQRLSPESTLGECGLTEVALVAVGGRLGSTGQAFGQTFGQAFGQHDIMALRREAAKAGQFSYLSSHAVSPAPVPAPVPALPDAV